MPIDMPDFKREGTGLSQRQADQVRLKCEEMGIAVPPPFEAARMYYEEIAKVPVPDRLLAKTGRPAGAPEATAQAEKVARELAIDLSKIKGTGIRGKITVPDVRAFLEENLGRIHKEIGHIGPPRIADDDADKDEPRSPVLDLGEGEGDED